MRKIDIPFGQPILDVEEIEAVKKVLEGPILAHGPVCAEFEMPSRDLQSQNLLFQWHQEPPHSTFVFTHQILVPAMK